MHKFTPRALVLLGPTASGKTALALELAKLISIEIISLDSALVYKGMDIGTAKPSKEELAKVPHHLIDICEPNESYSAASFREDTIRLVNEICQRGNLPLICGGTMMYYKALVDGLSPLPATDEKVREKIRLEGETLGWPVLHERLKTIDPALYKKLAPMDKQRISRALEVYEMTGRSVSSFIEEHQGDKCPFPIKEAVILPDADRLELRKLIYERFLKMLENGLIAEVEKLRARGDLNLNLPSMRSVGYRQVWEYLDGLYSYEEMIDKAVIGTARLAKHQMTWLRGGLKADRLVLSLRQKDAKVKLLELAQSVLNL